MIKNCWKILGIYCENAGVMVPQLKIHNPEYLSFTVKRVFLRKQKIYFFNFFT